MARMVDEGSYSTLTLDDGSVLIIQNMAKDEFLPRHFLIEAPVCYTPGTLILTPDGERPVETLAVGDLVSTHDAGPQPIRWIGRTEHLFPTGPHKHKPIQIKAGALGPGMPGRDLSVSPRHRMLFSGVLPRLLFGHDQVLALSKGLTGLPGVRAMNGRRHAVYYSLLLDRHHILFANGAASESFFPGPTALRMVPPQARREIESRFPRLAACHETGYGPTARPVLKLPATRELVQALLAEPTGGGVGRLQPAAWPAASPLAHVPT